MGVVQYDDEYQPGLRFMRGAVGTGHPRHTSGVKNLIREEFDMNDTASEPVNPGHESHKTTAEYLGYRLRKPPDFPPPSTLRLADTRPLVDPSSVVRSSISDTGGGSYQANGGRVRRCRRPTTHGHEHRVCSGGLDAVESTTLRRCRATATAGLKVSQSLRVVHRLWRLDGLADGSVPGRVQ